jgi:hypothetical protein
VHLFFLDGVGIGENNPAINPFVNANLPHLTNLLGNGWYLQANGRRHGKRATLVPTDANLGVTGRPQSATGQATILTGRNVSGLVGEHYGPKPNEAVRQVVAQGSLFSEVVASGGKAGLLTPYPPGFFDAVDRGKRLLSSVPLAVVNAGIPLLTHTDLRQKRAVSPGFTNDGWRTHLGYSDIPLLTLSEAGQQIAHIAPDYNFSFFEHWPSDRAGHRGTLENATQHLEMIDTVVGGILSAWDDENGLLIITSDHGNIEEKNHRQHTRNPVPTILVGNGHAEYGEMVHDLTDIAKVVRRFLSLENVDRDT